MISSSTGSRGWSGCSKLSVADCVSRSGESGGKRGRRGIHLFATIIDFYIISTL